MKSTLDPETRFSTHDADELSERLARATPHPPFIQSLGPQFHANVELHGLPRCNFFFLGTNEVRVSDSPSGVVGLNFPLRGDYRFRSGRRWFRTARGQAFLRLPGRSFEMTTSPRSSLLVVHFLEPLLASLEERLERPLGLAEFLSLETPMGRSFARYVQFVWDELRQDSVFMASALALRELEDSLASALLTFAEPELGERPTTLPAARSATLTRAEEYIRANLQKPLSVLEIAGATGVAPRTVTRAFRMHRGLGPSAFVRKLRLEAAHRDLLAGSSDDIKVCDVALKYGFNHLGRFAGDYRRLHGERPSDTLRRG